MSCIISWASVLDSPHITKQTVFCFFSMGIKVSGSCKSGQPTVLSKNIVHWHCKIFTHSGQMLLSQHFNWEPNFAKRLKILDSYLQIFQLPLVSSPWFIGLFGSFLLQEVKLNINHI